MTVLSKAYLGQFQLTALGQWDTVLTITPNTSGVPAFLNTFLAARVDFTDTADKSTTCRVTNNTADVLALAGPNTAHGGSTEILLGDGIGNPAQAEGLITLECQGTGSLESVSLVVAPLNQVTIK